MPSSAAADATAGSHGLPRHVCMVPPGPSDNTGVLMKEPIRGGTMAIRLAGVLTLLYAAACQSTRGPVGPVLVGTWGGDNAGLIATDTSAHVHIGCTVGDIHQALESDPEGRFDVPGLYNVTAYPVYRGPDHPARFIGRIDGPVMTLTVQLTDTAVVLGPVQLTYGKEPRMGPCPICRVPSHRSARMDVRKSQ